MAAEEAGQVTKKEHYQTDHAYSKIMETQKKQLKQRKQIQATAFSHV